jgi:hypothetical protein
MLRPILPAGTFLVLIFVRGEKYGSVDANDIYGNETKPLLVILTTHGE